MRYGFNDDRTKVDIDEIVSAAVAGVIRQLTDGLSGKVDKVDGKQLSTEDYSTADKEKLAGIADNAEVNVNADWNADEGDAAILHKPTTLEGYGITDAYTKSQTDQEIEDSIGDAIAAAIAGTITELVQEMIGQYISSLYKYAGTVATYADLPANASQGDTYNVETAYQSYPAGTNWSWTGTEWDALGGWLDLTAYATKAGIEALTNKTYNGYILADACAKGVDATVSDTTSTNLPTTAAVATYLNNQLGAIENGNY